MFGTIRKPLLAGLWLALQLARPASADMLLLPQGYLGEDDPWRGSGAGAALSGADWADGGRLLPMPAGVWLRGPDRGPKRYYTASLPTEAPLAVQLRVLAPLLGGSTLNRSQGLYADLVRQRPGTLLGWLNFQPHPKSVYISLVRDDRGLKLGDMVVAPESQDLRRVYALRGRARSVVGPGAHNLSRADGERIAKLLRRIP